MGCIPLSAAEFLQIVRNFRLLDVIDIAIVAYVLYKLFMLIRETRAEQLLKGLLVLLVSLKVSEWLGFYTINWILRNTVTLGLIALLIVFQPELRRALEQIGRGKFFSKSVLSMGEEELTRMVNEVTRAVNLLSKNKTGALIVIEGETKLNEIVETGVLIEGYLSAELLLNIFMPKSPLHDGAVIIRNGKLEAAGCFLNLTDNPNISKELGTRHRAAIGMSEGSDSLVVVVSEETGTISIAQGGKLSRFLDIKTVRERLRKSFNQEKASISLLKWKEKLK
jgi:diadenylate cyclase